MGNWVSFSIALSNYLPPLLVPVGHYSVRAVGGSGDLDTIPFIRGDMLPAQAPLHWLSVGSHSSASHRTQPLALPFLGP